MFYELGWCQFRKSKLDYDEGDVEDVDLSTMPVGASQVRGRWHRRAGRQELETSPEERKVFLGRRKS